jgi:hypothetical protein
MNKNNQTQLTCKLFSALEATLAPALPTLQVQHTLSPLGGNVYFYLKVIPAKIIVMAVV